MNIFIIIGGLLIGYFMYILGVLKSKKNDLNDILIYVKDKDIETVFDILSLIVITGLWLNTELISIIPKSIWFSPILGFLTPYIWEKIISFFKGKKIT